jgi:hypothetical protein
MKDIKIKATFTNSKKIIEFDLSSIVDLMGRQFAEDVSIAEEIGEEFDFLRSNFNNVILEIVT